MQQFTAAQLDWIKKQFAQSESIPGDWIISLPTSKLTGTILTAQIEDGAVTTEKIAPNAVNSSRTTGATCQFVAVDPVTGTSMIHTVVNGLITDVS